MMDYRRPSKPRTQMDNANSSTSSYLTSDLIYASFAPQNNVPQEETLDMSWDEERIEATVTRQFVLSHLRSDERARLDEPLGFGDGLTDDSYMEWIDQKAKRIFLILVDLGVPDQIFGVIDDSWDDDDLPVPLDQVERLQLTYDKDERLERKFYHRQFMYLLRGISKGDHLHYEEEETVPLEQAERKVVGQVPGLSQNNFDKVHLPGRPDDVFVRRKIPLGTISGRLPQEDFVLGVQAMKAIEHTHLMSVWASYTQDDHGFLLLTPANESNLCKFLTVTPPSFKILSKLDRRTLLLNWMHCLADAVSFLHGLGQAHRNLKPSAVLLDQDNQIFLGDFGFFSTHGPVGDRRGFDKESYDYAAPEVAQRPPTNTPVLVPTGPISRSSGVPMSRPGSAARRSTLSNGTSQLTYIVTNDSTLISPSTWSYPSPTSTSPPRNSPPRGSPPKRNSLLKSDPQKADIFALGAIFLEILTFFMKRASKAFASHRSAKNKTPGRGGGLPDSSFHKNLGQVETWITSLSKDASKKEDKMFRGVDRLLIITEKMLAQNPDERPSAAYVKDRTHAALTEFCGLGYQGTTGDGNSLPSRGRIHCDSHQVDETEFHFGFEDLRIASQRAAAEACANVSPFSSEVRTVGVNGGIVHALERNPTINSSSGTVYGNAVSVLDRIEIQDIDKMSTVTKSSRSSDGRSKKSTSSLNGSQGKARPTPKAWQAPVYAEFKFG